MDDTVAVKTLVKFCLISYPQHTRVQNLLILSGDRAVYSYTIQNAKQKNCIH